MAEFYAYLKETNKPFMHRGTVMEPEKNSKNQWQRYFVSSSMKYLKDEQPEYIEMKVLADNDTEAKNEIQRSPLKGIICDPKSDILEIQIDKIDHLISHPKKIHANEEDTGWLTGMIVVQRNSKKVSSIYVNY